MWMVSFIVTMAVPHVEPPGTLHGGASEEYIWCVVGRWNCGDGDEVSTKIMMIGTNKSIF